MFEAHIRWMIYRDLPEVIAIDAQSFDEPFGESEFKDRLRQRNCIGMVAEIGDVVVGHIVYELHKTKLELIRLAVHDCYRRRGIGRHMLRKLCSKLAGDRRNRVTMNVDERSLAAHLWLKACDFRAVRVIATADEVCYRFVRREEQCSALSTNENPLPTWRQ
jgi:[ribosomal protein S18]-alanine N-acetyltransferase